LVEGSRGPGRPHACGRCGVDPIRPRQAPNRAAVSLSSEVETSQSRARARPPLRRLREPPSPLHAPRDTARPRLDTRPPLPPRVSSARAHHVVVRSVRVRWAGCRQAGTAAAAIARAKAAGAAAACRYVRVRPRPREPSSVARSARRCRAWVERAVSSRRRRCQC
jgi:hypothetical protein